MTGVNIPADPAPDGYVENPFKDALEKARDYLRTESVSTDGWESLGTNSDIVMDKKQMPGDTSAIPLVRGRGIIKGVKPSQLLSIVSSPGARIHWDDRFQEGHPLKRYGRRSYKFYSIQKGAFLVSQRDVEGVQDSIISDDGTIEIFQTSIPSDEDAPEQSGKVRATLTVAGWALRPSGDSDTDATYIVKVNPAGSLPTSIIQRVVAEIPYCVVNVASFVKNKGLLSYIERNEIASVVRLETFELEKAKYTAALIGKAGDSFDILVDNATMYQNGYDVSLSEESDGVEISKAPNRVRVAVGDAADGKKFTITIIGV